MIRHASAAERHRAVREVLAGRPVGEVARRHGVSRQTLYVWRQRYAAHGEGGLRDRSRRPHRSPARIDPSVEALICSLRERHPDWGAGRLCAALEDLGVTAPPSRSTVHRVLVRNRLLASGSPAVPSAAGPAPGGRGNLGGLIAAAREVLDRLGSVLGGLEEPDGARTDPDGKRNGEGDGAEHGGRGGEGVAGNPPPPRLFAMPPSTISRHCTVIPRPREMPSPERPLADSFHPGSTD
ncbi:MULTISPECIES: helix-turn-helix domain-containing protein [unclassified Streptomyces]|uniref:helix-turn-helix domain-containing protein n=1 Tax=unclassified Streptomyces TaxID=2593676 RepID=UPI00166084BF|nr:MULTISPECIES: helix-turn-helix domain-containing protein [unclassified Streptomyces]